MTSQEQFRPPQGQAINLTNPTATSAEQHMRNTGEMLAGPDFVAGYNTLVDPRHPDRNEDRTYMAQLADGTVALGLFDGMGGHKGGDIAAQAANEALHDFAHNGKLDSKDRQTVLLNLFNAMQDRVVSSAEGSGSTATVALVGPAESDGSRWVDWASVGDSPLFVWNPETNETVEVTHEESQRQAILDSYRERSAKGENVDPNNEEVIAFADSYGNVVLNGLGEGVYKGLKQVGRFKLPKGGQLLLTSDGITGDKSTQRLDGGDSNERVIHEVLGKNKNVKQKAIELVQRAKKVDDRSALVFENTAKGEAIPGPEAVAPKQTLAAEIGLEDYNFRVEIKKPDGQILTFDQGWKITQKGKAISRKTGEQVEAYELATKSLWDSEKGEYVQEKIHVTKDALLRWQKERAEEERLREANRQNDLLVEQTEMENRARGVLQSAPSASELASSQSSESIPALGKMETPVDDMIRQAGFERHQKVYVPRADGSFMIGEVYSARTDEHGKTRLLVSWDQINPETGVMEQKGKPISVDNLRSAQKLAQEKGARIRGSGQILE